MLLSGAGIRNRSRVKVGPAPQHCLARYQDDSLSQKNFPLAIGARFLVCYCNLYVATRDAYPDLVGFSFFF